MNDSVVDAIRVNSRDPSAGSSTPSPLEIVIERGGAGRRLPAGLPCQVDFRIPELGLHLLCSRARLEPTDASLATAGRSWANYQVVEERTEAQHALALGGHRAISTGGPGRETFTVPVADRAKALRQTCIT